MNKRRIAGLLLGTLALGSIIPQQNIAAAKERPQTVVMTDGEVDDMDSFLRFLLYTNDVDVKGIIYTSSMWHYKGDGKGTLFESNMDWIKKFHPGKHTDLRWCGTEWIAQYIEKYRSVYPKLVQHDKNYPTPDKLQSLVKVGNIDFEGDMAKETAGSKWIEQLLLADDNGPIHFETWGGSNTFARALKSIEDKYKGTAKWSEIYDHIGKKVILYNIMDQDETYKNYIAVNWPNIKVAFNEMQFASLAYIWPQVAPHSQQKYLQGKWMQENILKGPIGGSYMTYGDGHKLAGDPEDKFGSLEFAQANGYGKYDLISEGDSPSYLYLIDNGLRSTEDFSYGGWSGRLSQSGIKHNVWEDNRASYDFNPETGKMDRYYSQTRWVKDIQNDFAARLAWTEKDYKQANHAPELTIQEGLDIQVRPGQVVTLHGHGTDPDGDKLDYTWYIYQEAGTYGTPVKISAQGAEAKIFVPGNIAKDETIHVICEVSDNAEIPLKHYARVILTAGEAAK
ncbi:hypothetical protein SELR_22670 [Selenomonas ruminantium subsp. lactilytica TAM6421]|uniref:DUF1593 domain-containing protein n=1 Tax=Selenomonas ruminantium subsp. lactilytica (strain NBRC 103574 / TAM6421) TaxID=927704 RepID=I0GT88_SELRL|nr:DUF1593 domain-containing protein [Selenomonas ruminantium]BAL83975.1 hypothetical protein SELR_22670 [Selenomonas ruminantium subsp. lactilytica TAM6421]